MLINSLKEMRDFLHAKLCYQLFITPLPMRLESEYQDFAERACELVSKHRSELIVCDEPRHHVIHHFAQPDNPQAKKILITHGWMSRAAYMIRLIRSLHQEGYAVYALDFPAHGEAKGLRLPWTDAVKILRQTLNKFGPFYGVIGHSFGGSMLLNTLNLAMQLPEWQLDSEPQKVVLIASPTRMRTPATKLARWLGLNASSYLTFFDFVRQNSSPSIDLLNFRHFTTRSTVPVLCIHGSEDKTILPIESILFCQRYPHASLTLLPDLDHVDVLIDKRVETVVSHFMEP